MRTIVPSYARAATLTVRRFCAMTIGSYSSIRLQELGPRLTLELMKVERGLCEGEVLYHSYVTKTAEEVSWIRATVDFERGFDRIAQYCC